MGRWGRVPGPRWGGRVRGRSGVSGGVGGGGRLLNDHKQQKLEGQNSWQQTKHVRIYSYRLLA